MLLTTTDTRQDPHWYHP